MNVIGYRQKTLANEKENWIDDFTKKLVREKMERVEEKIFVDPLVGEIFSV